jgi:hypothetical protein
MDPTLEKEEEDEEYFSGKTMGQGVGYLLRFIVCIK